MHSNSRYVQRTRRCFAVCVAACVGAAMTPAAAIVLPPEATVIPTGRICATSHRPIPDDAPTDLMRAVEEFRRDLLKGYGVKLPLGSTWPGIENHIEIVPEQRRPLDEDRTAVTFPEPHVMRITGGESGIIRTLFRLLEDFAGVRYLFQGEQGDIGIGAHFPPRETLAIPRKPLTYDSAFPLDRGSSQTVYGSHWPGERNKSYWVNWEMRLGTKRRLISRHHLPLIAFPVEDYARRDAADLPDEDIFPLHNGKRVLPWTFEDPHLRRTRWQPRYSSPAAVEEAVNNLLAYLRAHPDTVTLSLTVNDTGGFCDTERDEPSRHYFSFVNQVAERIGAEFPDVLFAASAYVHTIDPPPFKLHPNVVAILVFDLHSTLDPEVRAGRAQLIRDWAAVADKLAMRPHDPGARNYSLPCLYFREWQDMAQFFHEHGGIACFHERDFTTATEGPKIYLSYKLLEDPYLDVEAVVQDWCNAAVGEAAGVPLRAYYAFWEDFWRTKAVKTPWWDSRHATYLMHGPYDHYLYALEPGDLAHCRELMEQVVALAERHGTETQRRRAAFLMVTFEFYEANAISAGAEIIAADVTLPDRDAAVALLQNIPRAHQAYQTALRKPQETPGWIAPANAIRLRARQNPVAASIALVGDYLSDPEVIETLRSLAANREIPADVRLLAQTLYQAQTGEADNLVDGAFELETHGWSLPSAALGRIERSSDMALRGTHALKCEIAHGNFRVEKIVEGARPDRAYYVSARVHIPASQIHATGEGNLDLRGWGLENLSGQWVNRSHSRDRRMIDPVPGHWTYLSCIIPSASRMDGLRIRIGLRGFEDGDVAYIDDVQVLEIPEDEP